MEAGEIPWGVQVLTGVASMGFCCWYGDKGSAMESGSSMLPHVGAAATIFEGAGAARLKSSWWLTSIFCEPLGMWIGAWVFRWARVPLSLVAQGAEKDQSSAELSFRAYSRESRACAPHTKLLKPLFR